MELIFFNIFSFSVIDSSARLSLADRNEDSDEDLEGEVDSVCDSEESVTDCPDITLPDTLVSHIEKHLASREEDEDDEVLREKIQKYKEGLERGINDFLQQNHSLESKQLVKGNDLPQQMVVTKLNSNTLKGTHLKQQKYKLPKEGELTLEAINGFFIILTPELTVNYVSNNITKYLGHCPFSVMGQNIELFLHPKDIKRLQKFRDEIMKEGKYKCPF